MLVASAQVNSSCRANDTTNHIIFLATGAKKGHVNNTQTCERTCTNIFPNCVTIHGCNENNYKSLQNENDDGKKDDHDPISNPVPFVADADGVLVVLFVWIMVLAVRFIGQQHRIIRLLAHSQHRTNDKTRTIVGLIVIVILVVVVDATRRVIHLERCCTSHHLIVSSDDDRTIRIRRLESDVPFQDCSRSQDADIVAGPSGGYRLEFMVLETGH